MKKNTRTEVLYSRRRIATTIGRMAGEITRDYRDTNPVVVGVLKGSFIFLSDLVRKLDFPLEIDFIRVASYGHSTNSSHEVTLVQALATPIDGRHVLLVEDIIDSGFSIAFVKKTLMVQGPASVRVCCLLNKPSRREVDIDVDYTGFTVPDKFLVGYGLDFAEQHRNLPDICALEEG